jgi:hypothetical protein
MPLGYIPGFCESMPSMRKLAVENCVMACLGEQWGYFFGNEFTFSPPSIGWPLAA